jgi:polysaccharide biosynthesis transport protein
MDGIQPYVAAAAPRPAVAPAHGLTAHVQAPAHPHHPGGAPAKSPSDYIRALRRRAWLVLAVGVPLAVAGAAWVVRMPNVYRASAQILIEPPQFDPVLSTLLTSGVGHHDAEAAERYVPNRLAMLRGKPLAEEVVNDPAVAPPGGAAPDAADLLVANLQARTVPGTSGYVTVTLEGPDPALAAKQLFLLLEAFQRRAKEENVGRIDASKSYAMGSFDKLNKDLQELNRRILAKLRTSDTIGPGGKNIKQGQYELHSAMLAQKRQKVGDLYQQSILAQAAAGRMAIGAVSPHEVEIEKLEQLREEITGKMQRLRRTARYFDTDPSARALAARLEPIMNRLTKLRSIPERAQAADPYEALMEATRAEIQADERTAKALLAELQASMPDHQEFLDMLDQQKQMVERIATMQTKLSDFEFVSRSMKNPVTIPPNVAEPTVPVRPRRAVYLAAVLMMSFGLGIGLVCVLEHVDHSVKMPEQLTAGLALPLFGVVPRMRRIAALHRGGHLWTPGAPGSIEADAYRNLRASLLGVSDKKGPIVTLLVTSAKAGEGKSTTALNLAATCARAGERTLLMDVDLRRPSLADVFHEDDDDQDRPRLGLVDVLRGELPWQRTVARTDIPGLDFLPTGDTRDVPIEVLGTLELRQLLIALSSHYDRVILDGPAVLGLADCRMLGRVVDAALLVVRSGSQELRPLRHAKAMLEQSHVHIAGVVFNGLYEDLKNWSSYGPLSPQGYGGTALATPRLAGSSS